MQTSNRYLAGCALVGAAAFLYLQLFILPNLPMIPTFAQTIYLLDGWRMLHGEVMYRDFFQFNAPGSQTVWCALCYLFGARAWVVDAALICLGIGFAWTSVVISRKLFAGASIILPGFLFLAIAFRGAMPNGPHHWYSTLAVMTALAVLIERRSPWRLAVGGALCGVSAWFNQPRGLFSILGVGVFLLWERKQNNETWRSFARREARLLGSFLITFAGLNCYFVWKAGLKDFIYCTLVFVTKYYPSDDLANSWRAYGRDLPSLEKWYSTSPLGTWMVVELLVPWVYFLFFLRARRERATRPQEPWDRLMLVSIVGLCLFLSVAPAATNLRLCAVSVPAFILLVWLAKWPGKIERAALRLLSIGLLALMIAETHSIQTRWHGTLDLPVGRVGTFDRNLSEPFQWYLSHLKPPDLLFASPFLNFALGLQNPTPLDFFTTDEYTRPEQVLSVVESLEAKRARWVQWGPDLSFPAGPADHLGPLRTYLRGHYHVAKTFNDGNLQILERNTQ